MAIVVQFATSGGRSVGASLGSDLHSEPGHPSMPPSTDAIVHMAAQRPAIRATTSTMVMPEPATIEAASQLLAAKSQADELLGDAMALVFPAGTALAVAVRSAGLWERGINA